MLLLVLSSQLNSTMLTEYIVTMNRQNLSYTFVIQLFFAIQLQSLAEF